MWCGLTHEPLIDLQIYTKDWAFKVVGSVKWSDRGHHYLPLPTEKLFMATRMADWSDGPSFPNAWTHAGNHVNYIPVREPTITRAGSKRPLVPKVPDTAKSNLSLCRCPEPSKTEDATHLRGNRKRKTWSAHTDWDKERAHIKIPSYLP